MTAAEARQKLGNPSEKGEEQDYYSFNDKNTAQIYYNSEKKVYALSVNFLGGTDAPTPKTVLGADIEPGADGAIFKRVSYPKAGYWVAYSRTAGSDPLVTITLQKMQ